MARSKKKSLFGALEALGYSIDPSASGAGYRWWPTLSIGELRDTKAQLETNYMTGRNFPTAKEEGPDGWEFTMEVPPIGLTLAAGNGVNASTIAADWCDDLFLHLLGGLYTTAGVTVASVPDATGVVVTAGDPYNVQDLVVAFETGVPAVERSQWSAIIGDNGVQDYDVAPGWSDFGTNPPTAAAVLYGVKGYLPTDNGGSTLAFVYRQDGVDYTLLGGRCTSASITFNAGQITRMSLTFRGDRKIEETKGSLPAIGSRPANASIKGLRSPVWFNGTRYATRAVTIDLGVTAAVDEATEGSEGRGGDESISIIPTVTIEPQFQTALQDIKRVATEGPLLVQLGGGRLSGGVLNTMAFYVPNAQVMEADPTDDNGRIRQSVQFTVADPVTIGSAAARAFQIARA